ncbi:BamA/TamA family outer membrane protein [Sphingobacterium haloxyli]|uniref:Polymerase n=1 Tax=Sphingobacterium haloxyli TaxID=2100533 RepID=A0A2S9J3L2_9SPHI|nr:BamA/TamA family outer membrane protein [Sphingobacterium haloxyli]PRD47361.1 polymerase [Sphingobacterium haloxyli]
MFIKQNRRFGNLLLLSSLLTISFFSPTYAQEQTLIKKLVKKFLAAERDSTRSASLIVLPALGYAQETGVEYGIAGTYNFYLDKTDPASRTSNITLMGTLTTEKQKNIKLLADIWTKDNDYHILTELRYRDWPFNFYGLGSDTWLADEDFLEHQLARAKIDIEKKIVPRWYAGVNVEYENFKFNDREPGGIFAQPDVLGKTGGQYLALGVSSLYDTRDNTTYTTKGIYSRLKYAYAPRFWGGDNFRGSQLEVDIRGFHAISPKITLAAQTLYRGTFGENVPFYAYRDLGGDMTMRGYYLGRYKDKNYATAQFEFRYRFMPRLGIVGFGGTGSTFSQKHNLRLVPSFGGGIRYFFSLEHNSSVRLDYAIGEKRPGEKRQTGFYLSLSEAF